MKILVFGRNWSDYLQDDIYHGLKSLYGRDVESNANLEYMYEDYMGDTRTLYGMGFSYAKTLDPSLRNVIDSEEISQKLADRYYDAVIYLGHYRCSQQFEEVVSKVPWGRILLCDGEDDPRIELNVQKFKVFKRELEKSGGPYVFPISFAIPKSKIFEGIAHKEKKYAASVPTLFSENPSRWLPRPIRPYSPPTNDEIWRKPPIYDNSHYQFQTELDYYNDYRISLYAYTCRKSGWDCKRHYEIIANKCVPVFTDIEKCPKLLQTTLPKKLLAEIEKNHKTAGDSQYDCWLNELTSMREDITTTKLAEYVLSKVDDRIEKPTRTLKGGTGIRHRIGDLKIDLGCGRHKELGWFGIDCQALPCVDLVCDCNERIPLESDVAQEVRAYDFLEHIRNDRRIHIMNEIWRILKHGGIFTSSTPSTDGRGAFQDPTHFSFWNHYQSDELRSLYGIEAKFDIITVDTTPTDSLGICHVTASLRAVKRGV